MDNGTFEATEAGTPQGGVISPLLANIALDGMIRLVMNLFPKKTRNNKNYSTVIRYADDFVVISPQLEVIQQCQVVIEEWLKPIGLELKPAKTRICHTLREIEVNGEKVSPGFDFLGWNFRQYPVGKHHSGKTGHSKNEKPILLGFKTLIKPSNKAIKAHADKVKEVIKTHKTAPQYALIKRLNPIIRGWCNYHSKVVSKETFSSMDDINWRRLRAWTVSRCGKANYGKLKKYFRNNGNKAWSFETKDGYKLLTHAEIDHIIPTTLDGKDEYKNLQLLHRHCHDTKTSTDGSYESKEDRCSDENSQLD
jgi:Restriction endonuclease